MPTTPTAPPPATPETDSGPLLKETVASLAPFKPFNQDRLRGLFGGIDNLPTQMADHLKEQFSTSPTAEDDKKAYVNTLFLQDRFHKSFDEIADNKDFYRNQFAHQTYGQGEVDEDGLYTMAGHVLTSEHNEKTMLGGMFHEALNHNEGESPKTFGSWLSENRHTPGFNIKNLDLYTQRFNDNRDFISREGEELKTQIEPVAAMLSAARKSGTQDVNSSTWNNGISALKALPADKQDMVLALAARSLPKEGEKPFTEKAVKSVFQGADTMASDISQFANEQFGPTDPAARAAQLADSRAQHQVERKVSDIIAGKVDPQTSSNWVGQMALNTAKQLPQITSALTGPGLVLNFAATQQQMSDKFQDRGMTADKAQQLGSVAAVPEVAWQFLTGRMIAGRVPGFNGVLARLTSMPARIAATGLTEAGGLAVSATGQQVTPDIVQQIASEFQKEVPGMGWHKIAEDYKATAPQMMIQMLPLWLVGTGMGHFRDATVARETLANEPLLTAAGFPKETIAKVQAAPTVEAKEAILQADMGKREFGPEQAKAIEAVNIGQRSDRISTGKGKATAAEEEMIVKWKQSIAEELAAKPKTPEEVGTMGAVEFTDYAKSLSDKGGFTGQAQVLGEQAANSPEALQGFIEKRDAAIKQSDDARNAGEFDEAMSFANKAQFFREAYESATKTGGWAPEVRAIKHEDGTFTVQKIDTGEILAQTNTPEMAAKVIQDHQALQETSLKNAVGEMERKGYDLPDATQPEKRVMAESWNRAAGTLDKDPEAGARLAKELKANPNLGLSDDQSALLLRHKVGLENALNEAQSIINEPDASIERKDEATRQAADLSQQLLDFMDAVHRRGSEWGREGRWRQAMAKEDYSFAAQETLLRTAKGGAALTPEETTKLTNKLEAIKAKNDELEAKVKELSAKRSPTSAADAAVNRLARTARQPSRWRGAEAVRDRLHARAQASLAELIKGGSFGKARMGVSPKEIGHMLNIGADAIYSAGLDFAKWSTEMVSRIGEAVKPHLAGLWPDAQKMFHDEQRAGIVDALKAQTGINDEPNISRGAQELARSFIAQGVKGRDAVVDAVHAELKKAVPGITRRQAMDAISGYGDYKPLTHDEATDQLRDIKGQLQQLAKLEDLKAGERIKKTGVERREPSEEENKIRRELEGVLKMEQFSLPEHQPEPKALPPEKVESRSFPDFGSDAEEIEYRRMIQAKARLKAKQMELEDKIRKGDFEPAVKPDPVALDAEGLRIKSEVERLKQDLAIGRAKVQEAARPRYQKALSQIAGLARASALSGYHTLGKLAGFSFSRLVEAPFTESIGAIIRRVPGFRDVAGKANLEAGKELQGLGTFYAKFATDGMREASQTIRTGKGQLKAELGNAMHNALPLHWYDFPGLLHATEKSPLLVADFNLRLEKSEAHAIANGLDVTDPMIQGALRKEAFDYAQRAILQERNIVSDAINGFMDRLEKADPKTKKVDANKAALAAFIRTFITKGIIKTPLNHIAQTLEASPLGLLKGISDLGRAHMQGIGKLTPHEANTIIRLFKVAGVGTAVFVWGAIDATKDAKDRMFGGFFQPGEKRDDKDAKYGRMRIDGHELIVPAPIMMVAQMGSTFMRVATSKLHKKDKDDKGMIAGAAASVLALAQSAPIANPITNVSQTLERGQADTVLWDELASLVPQLVQNIAVDLDGKSRRPTNLKETIEATIPGLRENVPETKAQLKKDRRNSFTLRQQ